ncbi:hypothetical protein L2E82_09234 [Cichorium intybus]|uniref:Uncharacterized protein n=1 Tax=Cichorium intybus TaxID=13427 RepID=A0ACB9G7T5_CICIN|nr:hypothetical protein L2E82_09234 [Cichorium intybus]
MATTSKEGSRRANYPILTRGGVHRFTRPFCRRCAPGLNWPGRASGAVTLKKLECSKQAYALYTLAWDNIIGFRSYYVGLRDRSGGAWPFLVGGAICLVNSVNERDLSLLTSYVEIIAIVGLQRGIPSKRESSARVDYVPALCTHRPSLLPIEWSGEVLGSRRRGRFAAGEPAEGSLSNPAKQNNSPAESTSPENGWRLSGGRCKTLGVSLGGAAVGADLGGSSKYSNENFEGRRGERFHVNGTCTWVSRS